MPRWQNPVNAPDLRSGVLRDVGVQISLSAFMVRVNLINPEFLADQHLVAEYAEILMLVEYVRRYPALEGIPKEYCLGEGHQKFFKNKLRYLEKRHQELKKEMKKRGFVSRRTLSLKAFRKGNLGDWKPGKKDYETIGKRLAWKIKKKPGFYRYYGETKGQNFLIGLVRKGTAGSF